MGLLTPCHSLEALPKKESQGIPFYAGFEDIHPTKNYFILVGDTQRTSHWEFWRERNDQQRKLIIDEITLREPAFVVHLGDLTTRGSSTKHWQQFDDFHTAFRKRNIPYFPVLGNHELYGDDKRALENYFQRFPHLGQKRWYSFTWKNVGLLMVDSNFSALSKEQREQQSRWYLGELEKFEKDAGVDFIIVCCHEPPFTNSRVIRPNREVKVNFADPFLQFHKTQLFFSGHSHSYERFQMKGKFFIVSGGGGGPRHKVYTDPAKRRYQDLSGGLDLRPFHFCQIENLKGSLLFQALALNSDQTFTGVDAVTISRFLKSDHSFNTIRTSFHFPKNHL
jgi:predicted phosphodiesterase